MVHLTGSREEAEKGSPSLASEPRRALFRFVFPGGVLEPPRRKPPYLQSPSYLWLKAHLSALQVVSHRSPGVFGAGSLVPAGSAEKTKVCLPITRCPGGGVPPGANLVSVPQLPPRYFCS